MALCSVKKHRVMPVFDSFFNFRMEVIHPSLIPCHDSSKKIIYICFIAGQ